MSTRLTIEDFEKSMERAKSRPPMSLEEKEKLEELGRRMQNLSREERAAYRKKFLEENPYS